MSCGPVNAVQKLSSHSQVDRSLHQDAQVRQGVPSQSSFRSQRPNTLEHEFQAHQQQQNLDPLFLRMPPAPPQMQLPRTRQHQQPQSSWANDFKMTNMASRQQQQRQQRQQLQPQVMRSDWNTQFMDQMQQPQHQQQDHIQSQMFQQRLTPQLQPNMALNTSMNIGQSSEHRQLHQNYLHSQLEDMDQNGYDELEQQFASLEKQFGKVEMKEVPKVDIPVNNNAGFRDAAQKVADVMQSSKSDKFANSKFLDLMNKVTNGQVKLSQDETKLVDKQGHDIHEQQLSAAEPRPVTTTLPDPLQFVADGELETPFQAARLAGQSHGEKYTWDDVYDDYRNDDPSF